MPDEPRYTLDEAAAVLARQTCERDGHDLDQTIRWGGGVVAITCLRCGQGFIPEPEEQAAPAGATRCSVSAWPSHPELGPTTRLLNDTRGPQ